jgi:hypothetical protein
MPYTSLLLQVSSVVNEPGLEVREAALDATDQLFAFGCERLIAGVTHGAREKGSARVGGAGRDRTGDPLVANQVLSQLSYSPEEWWA